MSCLFHSLSRIIGEDNYQIRQKICNYLQTNPILYDISASLAIQIESGKNLTDYVSTMRSRSTWGGAIEIRAFVELWKRPVRVLVLSTRKWIEFPYDGDCSNNVCKISWNGGHYEPIL
jgi:hypothetical protein